MRWSSMSSQRIQLQHFYLAAAVIGVISAGLVGLLNYNLGQRIVAFSLMSLAVYVINAIVWTLLNALVIEKLDHRAQLLAQVNKKKSVKKTGQRKK